MKRLKLKDFLSKNKKIIYSIYLLIRVLYKNKLGRKFKYDLITQISLTLFKLRYNLPDRLLEDLFKIDHVTVSRIVLRISSFLARINTTYNLQNSFYIVDSTTLRIGKEKSITLLETTNNLAKPIYSSERLSLMKTKAIDSRLSSSLAKKPSSSYSL